MQSDIKWHVELVFTEDERRTRADAVLDIKDRRFHGWGQAKRAPGDPSMPVVGEELAAARAMSDLSHQLLQAAIDTIEQREGHSVTIHQ